jgi:hypothetical protein
MVEERPKRKQRIPLSSEELYYLKKLKVLNQIEKINAFKTSYFFKIFNFINICLCSVLAYYLFSVMFFCVWKQEVIKNVSYSRNVVVLNHVKQYSISEIDIETFSEKKFVVKTDFYFSEPKPLQYIFIGKDVVFNKILKTKFINDDREFWNFNTLPSFTLCSFSLLFGLFVYKVDKHLSFNGLLVVFGLFLISCLYFICI